MSANFFHFPTPGKMKNLFQKEIRFLLTKVLIIYPPSNIRTPKWIYTNFYLSLVPRLQIYYIDNKKQKHQIDLSARIALLRKKETLKNEFFNQKSNRK